MSNGASQIDLGAPHVAGTGVTVRTIVRWYKLGLVPEEIVREIPHLSLGHVYGALAYYHLNQQAMESQMAAEEVESDKLEVEYLSRKNIAA